MIKAVIFDLDGTLTDADLDLAKRKVSEKLASLSGELYDDIWKKMERIHYRCNIEGVYDRNEWWDLFDFDLSPHEKGWLTNLYWTCVMETTQLKPHAEHLLKALKEKVILVLLTDHDGKSFSKRKRIESLPLLPYFNLVVISGDDTEEVKPSPEPFTYILTRLGLAPNEVLMVGDKSEVDLAGAHRLGMHTLLLEGDFGNEWNPSVTDLRDALVHIENLLQSCQ